MQKHFELLNMNNKKRILFQSCYKHHGQEPNSFHKKTYSSHKCKNSSIFAKRKKATTTTQATAILDLQLLHFISLKKKKKKDFNVCSVSLFWISFHRGFLQRDNSDDISKSFHSFCSSEMVGVWKFSSTCISRCHLVLFTFILQNYFPWHLQQSFLLH